MSWTRFTSEPGPAEGPTGAFDANTGLTMADKPRTDSSLAALRAEIDHIDETMHGLLMQRGEIIDRLIAVKQTQENASAFRPAREAEMMRRLVDRHHGILPLDTAESIW